MADLESFSSADSGAEGSDPAALERLRERMANASAQIKAMQVGEQKQRKNESELIKILLKFIKSRQKGDQLLLVARLLDENIPANFIVSLLALSNHEIREELGIKLLPSLEQEQQIALDTRNLPDIPIGDAVLPLKIKIALTTWFEEIYRRSSEVPDRLLKTIYDADGGMKLAAVQLATFNLRDFLEEQNAPQDYQDMKNFLEAILQSILQRIHYEFESRGKLKGPQERN